jgi:hypothetical protein
VIRAASLSISLRITATKSKMYLCLVRIGVVDHDLKAVDAASTAELNSASVDNGDFATTS